MKIVDKIRNKMGQNPESEEYIEEVDNTDDSDLQATTYQNPDNVVDFKNKAKNNQLKVMVILGIMLNKKLVLLKIMNQYLPSLPLLDLS